MLDPQARPAQFSLNHRAPRLLALAISGAALSACGTYEPPLAGVHRGPGDPPADITCSYETPTASRFVRMRCEKTDDLKARGDTDRQTIDEIRTPAPVGLK